MTVGPRGREEEAEDNDHFPLVDGCFLACSLAFFFTSFFPSYTDSDFTSSHSVVLAVFFVLFSSFFLLPLPHPSFDYLLSFP